MTDSFDTVLSTAVNDSITDLRDQYEATIREWCELLHISAETFAKRFEIEEYPMEVTPLGDGKFAVAQRLRLVRKKQP